MSALDLVGAAWLTAPATRAVISALEAGGGPDCARFVGGCVRDALLGRSVEDIDIATRLTPDRVIAALQAAGLKAVPTGVDHGTVTAVARGKPFEITTLRRDVETDGRRAVVAFTDDWREDAQRRDFRLNALYADAQGVIFDPTGEGVADALAGRIVFVGDPRTRIAEDALRILRFFRFLAWFGRGAPDADALSACAALKAAIGRLSAERISKELLKLLAAPDPRMAVALMAQTGVLGQVLPQAGAGELTRFDRLVALTEAQSLAGDPLLRLAALSPDDPAAAAQLAARLRLSKAQRIRLVAALTEGARIDAQTPLGLARALIYRAGAATFQDRLLLAWAAGSDLFSAAWSERLDLAATWRPPKFPLTGDDALTSGAPAGPSVGAVLQAVETWWIAQDFPDDRAALMRQLRDEVAALRSADGSNR